jgi:hypothetical protein
VAQTKEFMLHRATQPLTVSVLLYLSQKKNFRVKGQIHLNLKENDAMFLAGIVQSSSVPPMVYFSQLSQHMICAASTQTNFSQLSQKNNEKVQCQNTLNSTSHLTQSS